MDALTVVEGETISSASTERNVHPKNILNDLTAAEWISRTVSVFAQKGLGRQSTEAAIERQHPAPFSYSDIVRFIEFFTKSGETVLDPFVGIGSTLKACAVTGRRGVGIELNPKYADLARERLATELEPGLFKPTELRVLQGDVRLVAPGLPDNSVDFIVTSPPYWGILNKVDHKARQERLENGWDHNYGSDNADLAHISTYPAFIQELGAVFQSLVPLLRPKRYMVVIVGDFRNKERYHMLHSDLVEEVERRGAFALKGITIIHQKFKRVFPYGYPYSYVPNIHHQYALVFQKLLEADHGS